MTYIYLAFNPEQRIRTESLTTLAITIYLNISHSFINPLIYLWRLPQVRAQLFGLFMTGKDHSSSGNLHSSKSNAKELPLKDNNHSHHIAYVFENEPTKSKAEKLERDCSDSDSRVTKAEKLERECSDSRVIGQKLKIVGKDEKKNYNGTLVIEMKDGKENNIINGTKERKTEYGNESSDNKNVENKATHIRKYDKTNGKSKENEEECEDKVEDKIHTSNRKLQNCQNKGDLRHTSSSFSPPSSPSINISKKTCLTLSISIAEKSTATAPDYGIISVSPQHNPTQTKKLEGFDWSARDQKTKIGPYLLNETSMVIGEMEPNNMSRLDDYGERKDGWLGENIIKAQAEIEVDSAREVTRGSNTRGANKETHQKELFDTKSMNSLKEGKDDAGGRGNANREDRLGNKKCTRSGKEIEGVGVEHNKLKPGMVKKSLRIPSPRIRNYSYTDNIRTHRSQILTERHRPMEQQIKEEDELAEIEMSEYDADEEIKRNYEQKDTEEISEYSIAEEVKGDRKNEQKQKEGAKLSKRQTVENVGENEPKDHEISSDKMEENEMKLNKENSK